MAYIGQPPNAFAPLSSADIPDGIIVAADLAPNSVDSSELVDGSIDTSHIGDDQVTADKLANSINTDIATGVTANTTANAALPKAGGTMSGNIVMGDDTSIGIADDAERIEFDGAGDISVLGANLGVGTSAPSVPLHVEEAGSTSSGTHYHSYMGTDPGIRIGHKADGSAITSHVIRGDMSKPIQIGSSNADASDEGLWILHGGNVGIGTSAPEAMFHVNSTRAGEWGFKFFSSDSTGSGILLQASDGNNSSLYINNNQSGANQHNFQGDGDFHHAGSDVSDERLKENIVDCEHGLTEVLQLTPRRFNFIENPDITKHGWIAQEVKLVMDNMTRGDDSLPVDGGGKMSMDYAGMTAVLCKAVQELSANNDALEARVLALENA